MIKTYEDSRHYQAVVVQLPAKHDLKGLDNLKGVSIFGNQVIVGKDEPEGTVGLYFPVETQLSEVFLKANNLYRDATKNNDPTKKGYFEANGRIRAQKFKGNDSCGFWLPIDSIEELGVSVSRTAWLLGEEFNEFNGIPICRKYIVVRQQGGGQGKPGQHRKTLKDLVDTRIFREHVDTDHLFRNIFKLDLDNTVSITWKMHGTSLRVGNVPVDRNFGWLKRFLSRWIDFVDYDYRFVVGTRKTIKEVEGVDLEGKEHYYKANPDLYRQAAEQFKGRLHKGEIVYAEIIGWVVEGKEIQKDYTYGMPNGTKDVYVYRISRVNPDGVVLDLTWPQMKKRCEELDAKHVRGIYYGDIKHSCPEIEASDEDHWRDVAVAKIKSMLEQPSVFSTDDWSQVEEGIVVCKENLGVHEYYKSKSVKFLEHETKMMDQKVVDIEEQPIDNQTDVC